MFAINQIGHQRSSSIHTPAPWISLKKHLLPFRPSQVQINPASVSLGKQKALRGSDRRTALGMRKTVVFWRFQPIWKKKTNIDTWELSSQTALKTKTYHRWSVIARLRVTVGDFWCINQWLQIERWTIPGLLNFTISVYHKPVPKR